jgi:hypothetical protein
MKRLLIEPYRKPREVQGSGMQAAKPVALAMVGAGHPYRHARHANLSRRRCIPYVILLMISQHLQSRMATKPVEHDAC